MFEFLFNYSREDYARSELVYANDWPFALVVTLIAVGIGGILFSLVRRRGYAGWPRLAAIGILQLTMLALVVWVLLQPNLLTEQLRAGENTVALVIDSSASMAYGESESRLTTAIRALSSFSGDDETSQLALRQYEMNNAALPVQSFAETSPTGATTAIGPSVAGVLREARVSPLAAVILASDGADTAGGLGAQELAEIAAFGVPVHTIGIGRTVIAEDIEMTEVAMPGKVLPGSTVAARVSIRHDRQASTQVKVYDGDDLLAVQDVSLNSGAGVSTAWIDVELPTAGHRQLRFSVDGGDVDLEQRNNSRSTLVEVANQSYKVLYYEGEPRWEYKFLRRAMDSDDDIQLASLLRVSQNKFYRQGIETPQQLENGFPETRDELFSYDALLIGSVEAASLTSAQMELIKDFVSVRGGSLLMLAGPNGLGNGGWGQTTVADVLPVTLPPSTRDTFFRKRATAELTPQGGDLQMLRFAESEMDNLKRWTELPEVADYQVTGNLKPAAAALLTAQTDVGRIPLLVSQPYGRGHSYVLASGGTWRWQMSMPVEDQSHEVFWRQLIRAMVASAPEHVSLSASTDAGESNVHLRAEFRDEAFRPVDGVGVSAVATHADGSTWTVQLQPDANEPGVYGTDFVPDESGTWYFEAIAERDGEPVDVSRASIHFETGQAEHFNIRRNATLLQQLSEATGGRYLEVDDIGELPDLLRYSSSGITEHEYRPIWDAPAVFLLLFLIKTGEWLLRRRWSTI